MVPLAARTFVNRCRPGSTGSFEGTAVHKALRGLAVYAGLSRKYAPHTCGCRLTLMKQLISSWEDENLSISGRTSRLLDLLSLFCYASRLGL